MIRMIIFCVMKTWSFLLKQFFKNLWKRDWRLIKQYKTFIKQQFSQGWNDSDLWNLDMTISEFILPRLIRYRELYGEDLSDEDWDKMIGAFKYSSDFYNQPISDIEKSKEGLRLFAENYFKLWD